MSETSALEVQDIERLLAQCPNHGHLFSATTSYLVGAMYEQDFEALLADLSACPAILGEDRFCVLVGYGSSHLKNTYEELRQDAGLRVLWSGVTKPPTWWLYPLCWIFPDYGGFVSLEDPDVLPNAFRRMADLAMVDLFSCSIEFRPQIEELAFDQRWQTETGKVVGADRSYFSFGVDTDNKVSTGILGWASFGSGCPSSLKQIVLGRAL